MSGVSGLLLLAQTEVVEAGVPQYLWVISSIFAVAVVVGLFAFSFVSKAGTIASATCKEAIRQPIFLLLLAIASLLMFVNTITPFFSFGDDVKMLKDCGLATILICGLLQAVWTSSTTIAEEIEGKTAMTLLSKPINRRQFIVGKYIGILQSVLLLLLPVIFVFFACIYYKVGYDARESSLDAPTHLDRLAVVFQIIPGCALIFLEIAVVTAVSVAISTRLPMMVNLVSCLAIFIIGHLTPQLVKAGALKLEFVKFTAQLIATVLPNLESFQMQTAVATGVMVPPAYLGYAFLYCVVYCAAAILLAFILFEDRDLA